MTITFEQIAWAIGVIGTLLTGSWWVVTQVTKSKAQIEASIERLTAESTKSKEDIETSIERLAGESKVAVERLASEAKSSIASLERATQERANTQMDAVRAMHAVNEVKMDRMTDRLVRVENV